ncbi:MmgE/PrpD family protein [Aquabacterium sp. OR-4]|uniref:MmgE/PrpD family protein n=1 Tax=Aquabacterium sp. OR-4 TaxID=2978127 RepID=UPI0028C8855C|nr:MmgE/PrpD family protein [Aquabacterium sp. OR-4]MDT7836942.1 MmgE/PrpD family protein [Aquabacterium sp. OR-4]
MNAGPMPGAKPALPADAPGGRLVDFIVQAPVSETPGGLLHQAKRLLLSRLWASATAALQPDGQAWLQRSAERLQPLASQDRSTDARAPRAAPGTASVWWHGGRATSEQAAGINQRLSRLQPHAATHLPTGEPLCADLLPVLMATAQARGLGGRSLLQAWAIGTEVALAQAAALGPHRPETPDARTLAAPAADLGLLAAMGRLLRQPAPLLARQLLAATGHSVDGLARVAAELPSPRQTWRLQSLLLHTRPAAAVALAPIEAALRLRAGSPAVMPQALELGLSPQAWPLADAAEVSHKVASAWLCGQYTLDEELPPLRQNPALVALRQRMVLRRDPTLQGLTQAALSVVQADGRVDLVRVDRVLGAPDEPLSDAELAELFRQAADDLVLPQRAGEILGAVWGLERLADSGDLARLLCRPC